jgi:hypothetical protein
VQEKAPEVAAPPPPPKDVSYAVPSDPLSDYDRQKRAGGVQSWLALDDKGRQADPSTAMALSFGGQPTVYVRGGSTGVRYFRDQFKKQDQDFKATGAAPSTIPYEELRLPSKWNRPDIDPLKREIYLSDAEFKDIFKMSRDIFKELPAWKMNQLKQIVKLY